MHRLFLLLPLVCASCGGGSDPRQETTDGTTSLARGDYEEARESFDDALAAIGDDTAHAYYVPAKLGRIEALAHLDADQAKEEFLAFAEAHPAEATDRVYSQIASRLGDAGALGQATEVLAVAMETYPESPPLEKLLQRLGDEALKSGKSEELSALEGLGYAGSD